MKKLIIFALCILGTGNYELYIYSEAGTVMAGEFNIE